MRDIKFRGLSNNPVRHWHFGYLVSEDIDTGRLFIRVMNPVNMPPRWTEFEVDPKTVGQYTGLKDRNGVEIYEGDIVKFNYWWFDGLERETELTGVIRYNPVLLSYELAGIANSEWITHVGGSEGDIDNSAFSFFQFEDADFEVIGNIHENPELIGLQNEVK